MSEYNIVVQNDSRIQDIASKLDVIMKKGPAASSYQKFPASSKSVTSVNFNVPINSESTIVDRHILIETDFTLKFDVTVTGADGVYAFQPTTNDSLQAFPFNSLITTANVDINNNSHTVNVQEMMSVLCKTVDNKLFEHECPYMFDTHFKHYRNKGLSDVNPMGAATNAIHGGVPARGSYGGIVSWQCEKTGTNPGVATNLAPTDAHLKRSHADNAFNWTIRVKTVEPLLFSPIFLYHANNNNSCGMYNVTQMLFNFNIDSTAKRALSFTNEKRTFANVRLDSINECNLRLNFITKQPSSQLSNLQILPFIEHQRLSTITTELVTPGNETTIVNNSLTLNQIPDMIYIAVRKPVSTCTVTDSNSFWPIKAISINFNNMDSLLSTATTNELFRMSKKNGIQLSHAEFTGKVVNGVDLEHVYTLGSIIALSPEDLNLPDNLAPGSIGNFTFQVTVRAECSESVASKAELLIIERKSSILRNENGETAIKSGLFTQDMVTNATMSQFGESSSYIKSYSKGSGNNTSVVGGLKNVPLLNSTKSGGNGVRSGGAYSGGAYSGGAHSGGSGLSSLY